MADAMNFTRSEMIALVARLGFLSIATFFAVRWMCNQIDPTKNQKNKAKKAAREQLRKVGVTNIKNLTDYEMVIAAHLVDPNDITITWSSIAGLNDVINELRETVILPVQRRDLFVGSRLTQPPKGVLLHGPPGCGKTMIAKATAREGGMHFINLDVSILTDKWYGESQKLAAAVFSLAEKLQPCIIFMDEIDSFLRARSSQDHEATAMMKAQFMSLWDGLITNPCCTVIVMGATNRPQDVDRAIIRRMPATFSIRLPGVEQRKQILQLILRGEPVSSNVDVSSLARQTDGFSGSDLREMCRNASIYRVRDYMKDRSEKYKSGSGTTQVVDHLSSHQHGQSNSIAYDQTEGLREMSMTDFLTALNRMKESKVQCGTMSVE